MPRMAGLCTPSSVLTALLLFTGIPLSAADRVVLTLDPEESVLTLSGSVLGADLSTQGPESLTTHFEGEWPVEIDAGSIRFLNEGILRAQTNGTWQPGIEGADGSAPANYSGRVTTLLASAVAAARNLEFRGFSGSLAREGNNFDSGGIVFQFLEGGQSALDYRTSGFLNESGRLELTGLATNDVTGSATLSTDGEAQVLRLPISATFYFTLLLPDDVELVLTGELVARTSGGGTGGTGFADFVATHFPGETNPTVIGPDGDPDGDGLANVVEYAFGLNPTVPDEGFAPLEGSVAENGSFQLRYLRPAGMEGVSYRFEAASTLGTWSAITPTLEVSEAGEGQERVEATIDPPTGNDPARFVRLIIALDP